MHWRDFKAYLRARGVRGVIRALITRFVYRCEERYVTVRRLEDAIPELPAPDGVLIRQATAADVEAIQNAAVTDGWWQRRAELSHWVRQGYPVGIAEHDDRVVGYACVIPNDALRDRLVAGAVDAGPGDAWGADAFVARPYRGRGVYPAIGAAVLKKARSQGYRRVLSTIAVDGNAALSAHTKTGVRVVGKIHVFRLMWWSRTTFSRIGGGSHQSNSA